MTYKTLLIDVDGTLYSGAIYLVVSRRAAERLLDFVASMDQSSLITPKMLDDVNKGRISYTIDYLCGKMDVERERFFKAVYDIYPEDFGIVKDERLIKCLIRVRNKYGLALFTNSPIIWVNRVLNQLGVANFFAQQKHVTVETLGYGQYIKPKAESMKIMMDTLHEKAENLLYLDDSEGNVTEARKFGIDSIHINNDSRAKDTQSVYEVLEGLEV